MTVSDANKALRNVLATAAKQDKAAFLSALKELQSVARGENLPTPFPVAMAILSELHDEHFAKRGKKS